MLLVHPPIYISSTPYYMLSLFSMAFKGVCTASTVRTGRTHTHKVLRSELSIFNSLIAEDITLWYNSVLDVDVIVKRTASINVAVSESITRQQLDGVLSLTETERLRFIHKLWVSLQHFLQVLACTSDIEKNYIHSLLLNLYTFNQLTERTFTNILKQL